MQGFSVHAHAQCCPTDMYFRKCNRVLPVIQQLIALIGISLVKRCDIVVFINGKCIDCLATCQLGLGLGLVRARVG
jgi:hypothetical protein